ncbi:MAG: amidohydrolase family protein [Planctomycetota bacterium]
MSGGHRPTEVTLGRRWIIEGRCLGAGDEEARRTRLLIDRESGTIRERGDLPGAPDRVLPESCLLLPGLLDLHVHCRDDPSGAERHKEDFGSASLAALHGGVVLIGDMPNNPRAPVDARSHAAKRALVDERALVDVLLYAGIAPGTRPLDEPLPYKCYYGPSVGDLDLSRSASPGEALAPYRGCFVSFHAEKSALLEAAREAPTHEQRRPPEAEARAIEEIARIAADHGLRAHIAHLSSAAGLEEVRRARAGGLPMTCEVAPHHLCFDQENRAGLARGEWLRMNPPLRAPEDRRTLREAFLAGEIDILATDHAPHTIEENARGISGVPHLDTVAPLLALLAAEGFPWPLLMERAAAAPARLFADFIDGRLGDLEEGALASFTVIDLESPWTVAAGDLSTRAGWSPFEGLELPGRVVMTAVRGRMYEMR